MESLLALFVLVLPTGFAHAGMIGTGPSPQVIAAGDLNQDGHADLVSGNAGDNTVAVSLGRGDGTFAPKVQYACTSLPTSLAIADLNQDGHPDLAIACPGTNRVQVRFGAGDGTLGAPNDNILTAPVAIVATSWNNESDGFMDLMVVNSPTGATVNFMLGVGDGTFAVGAYTSPYRSVHLAAGDVDNDGHPDLVFANAADSVAVVRGNGGGAIFGLVRYGVQGPPSSVAIADFDQDGNPDIVAAIPGANALNVMLGNGDGTFDPYTSIPCGTGPRSVASADFNGDNLPDLAVTASGGATVAVLIGTGGGAFQPNVDYPAGVSTQGLAIAQLDANATADLAVAASGQNSICTLPGIGNGTFQVPTGPVYVWASGSGLAWLPEAWLPSRGSSSGVDVLVFNLGGAISVSQVPSAGIGQIVVSGGTQVSFSGFFGATALSLVGGPGDDGVIEQGSKVILASNSSPVQLNAASGATMAVSGDIEIRGGNNRLQALDANGIVFQSTGRAIIGPGASTTPLGNGTGASGLNSVLFRNGSLYIAQTTVDVFGAAAPAAVVAFQPGSRFRMDVAFNPEASGRTYADLELNVLFGTSVLSGSNPLQVDSLIVTAGNLVSTMTGTVTIRGNVAVPSCGAGDGTLKFLPASPMTVRLAGSARQWMRPNLIVGSPHCFTDHVFYMAPNVTLNIDNPAGIEFVNGFRTSASISFTSGTINTRRTFDHALRRYRITVDSTGTISGAGASSGWVAAPVMRRVTTNGTFHLATGDSISYQPVDVTVHGVTGPGYIYAGTAPQEHWAAASAPLDQAHLPRRSWLLLASDDVLNATPATYLSSLDARLRFSSADLPPGTDPLQFEVWKWPNAAPSAPGAWYPVAFGNQTPTSIDVTGIPAAELQNAPTFQAGQASPVGAVDDVALAFALAPIPNPARSARSPITFVMHQEARVRLTVHDLQGRRVASLADDVLPAGRHARTWDATGLLSGVYFVRLEAPGFRAQQRVTVLR